MTKPAIIVLFVMAVLSCKSASELKSEQYFVEGYNLYTTYCANCHQADGKGMSNLYPPLAKSDRYNDKSAVACIIRNGMKGTIIVDGKEFNRPMPANPKLTEIEIAELVSFLSMKWGQDSVYTSIETVQAALKNCKEY
ncbi:cytochrome c [Dyadobacter sp. CY347]|uniref:c-type cytochrome n=1 Tax=Dyadobacter sp. CY347 TaxID=2909336 RepID=UPI001F195DA2|nr:cytochrome c [Dyadobacter sp. CY347]MCF2487437.1 cytochrome c [Dyadobacter sp. CY347]